MSNPLLKSNDPRFQRPALHGDAGQNRFAEDAAAKASEGTERGDVFAASEGEARPFEPRYEAQQPLRTTLLYVLGGLGWVGAAFGVLALLGWTETGWICPLLGLGPAAAAWLLAWEDVKAIRAGAMSAEARPAVRLAMSLGLLAFFACIAIVAAMIYRQLAFLPDVI